MRTAGLLTPRLRNRGSPPRAVCPACGTDGLLPFFEMRRAPVYVGVQYATARAARRCPRGDIRLALCTHCGLIANTAFDASRLDYSLPYDNALDHSPFFQAFARRLAGRLVARYGIRGGTVVDVGCGQGEFLRRLCAAGDNRGTGFDPSLSAETCRHNGDDRVRLYDRPLPGRPFRPAPDLACCRHVLEHVERPGAFLLRLRRALGGRPGAIVYFEVPNVRTILRDLSVWTIIYEHCNYFSRESLRWLFEACGFRVLRVRECYRGQFLGLEARLGARPATRPAARTAGLRQAVRTFTRRYGRRLATWRRRLAVIERSGARVAAWGAGARTVCLFNALRITRQIPYVVDINPRKQGAFLPGTGQRIVPPEHLKTWRPSLVVIMNDVYEREIRRRIRQMGLRVRYVCA